MNEDMILPFKEQCPFMETTYSRKIYEICLDEGIREPAYYRDVLSVIRNCSEGDLVKIILCNGGGQLNSAVMFRNAIAECQGEVLAVIEGDCHSAASMIALSCHGVHVKPYASMLIHCASYGTYNTMQNVYDHVAFTQSQTEKLIREIYKHFLSSEEVEQVIRNREIWLTDEEIGERLDRMYNMRAKEEEGCSDPNCLCHTEQGEEPEEDFIDLESLVSDLVNKKLAEKSKKSSKKAVDKEKPEA